jgi:flagellar biosynthetic protein FliR
MEGLPEAASAFLLLYARIGAVLMLLPLFGEEAVPTRIRLLLGLGTTFGLWGLLSARVLPVAANAQALPGALIAELMVGLAIGIIVKIMFQAAAMAGSIISFQIGLSSALINDASQGGQVPLLSKFVSMAATLVCLTAGVHHLWIAAMVQSYALFPVGVLPPAAGFAQLAIGVTGKSMALALGLAAPMLVYGIVLNIALGLSVRLAPAIQIFFIAQPLTIMLGLTIFAILLGPLLIAFSDAMASWLQTTWA